MLFVIFSKDSTEVITLYYSVKTLFAYVTAKYINVRTYDFNVKLLFNTFDIQFETSEKQTRHVVLFVSVKMYLLDIQSTKCVCNSKPQCLDPH